MLQQMTSHASSGRRFVQFLTRAFSMAPRSLTLRCCDAIQTEKSFRGRRRRLSVPWTSIGPSIRIVCGRVAAALVAPGALEDLGALIDLREAAYKVRQDPSPATRMPLRCRRLATTGRLPRKVRRAA